MVGFVHNVLGGIAHEFEHIFDTVYQDMMTLFSPVATSVVSAFKANGAADFATFMVDVGQAINSGQTGSDLVSSIEGAAKKQGVVLGTQVLKAFGASLEVNFQMKAAAATPPVDPGPPPSDTGAAS